MAMTWAIWRCRNHIVWNDKAMSVSEVSFLAAWSLTEWKDVRLHKLEKQSTRCHRWHRAQAGHITVSVDARFYADSMQTGAGFVARNSDGGFIGARSILRDGLLRVGDGEAWGMLEAIKWAAELGYDNVIVETNAQVVRNACCSDGEAESIFGDYIRIVKEMLEDNRGYTVKWVCRNTNALAHAFARAAFEYGSTYSWDEPPLFVDGLLDWCTSCT